MTASRTCTRRGPRACPCLCGARPNVAPVTLGPTWHHARPNMATALGLTLSSPPASRPGGKHGEVVVCGWCVFLVSSFLLRTASKAKKDHARRAAPYLAAEKSETCSCQMMCHFCTTTTTRKQRRNWRGAQLESL